MPSGKKPPSDPAKAAKSILDQVTGAAPKVSKPTPNPAAAALGALGGAARAKSRTPEELKRIAAMGAAKRWEGHKKKGTATTGKPQARSTDGVE